MTSILLNVIEISLSMGIVTLLTFLFYGIAGKRFTAKCRYLVWILIVIRLCIPINVLPISPVISLTIPTETYDSEKDNATPSPESIPVFKEDVKDPIPDHGSDLPSFSVNKDEAGSSVAGKPDVKEDDTVSIPVHSEHEKDTEKRMLSPSLILKAVSVLWLTGTAILLAVKLCPYIKYSHAIRRSGILSVPDDTVNEVYRKTASDMGLHRIPKLWVSSAVSSPMLVGYIRPFIIIPKADFEKETLSNIFRHELVHFRRGDLYIKLLCAVTESLHWFNPLVHIATRRCISEMELSCDESALKGIGENERIMYGEALMEMVKNRKSYRHSLLTTEFSSKEGSVKERIINITDTDPKQKGVALVALILVLCTVSGTFMGSRSEAAETKPEIKNEYTAETDETQTEDAAGKEDVTEEATNEHGQSEEALPVYDSETNDTDVPGESDSESDTAEESDTEPSTEYATAESDEPAEYPTEEAPPAETVCEHTYTVSSRYEATCTEDGSITYACITCGDRYSDVLSATGHSMSNADCTAPSACLICGAVEGVPLGHDFAEATFTSPITCNACGATVGEPLPPLNVDVERFKSNKDYSRPGVIPISSECSICYKAAYYDLEREYVHDAKRLSAVKIDDVAYSFDGVSETGKYNVSFTCEGEVVLDETDLDTAYICLVIFNEQTNRGTDFKLPYSDFSEGSKVEFSLSTQLESGDYRIYFKNQDIFIVDDH